MKRLKKQTIQRLYLSDMTVNRKICKQQKDADEILCRQSYYNLRRNVVITNSLVINEI